MNSRNVGATLRAAYIYGAAFVAISGSRYTGSPTDTCKGARHLPLFHTDDLRKLVPHDCVPVAVDLLPDAVSIVDYEHPQRAFYIFGAENATLDSSVLSWCEDKIFVPTNYCMNLAACVNVVLYDRMAKATRKKGIE